MGRDNHARVSEPARLAVAAVSMLSLGATSAFAEVYHVYEGESIRDVIDIAVDGDEIIVHPGTYVEHIEFWGKAITVRSSDGPETTILDGTGGWETPVVGCDAGTFEGFTVTDGPEGGIVVGGDANVSTCLIIDNAAHGGGGVGGSAGGMYVSGSPILIECIIRDNKAWAWEASGGSGGGVVVGSSATPTFINCAFEDNVAQPGYAYGSSRGGGMYNSGNTILINCKFTGNKATHGGGVGDSWGPSCCRKLCLHRELNPRPRTVRRWTWRCDSLVRKWPDTGQLHLLRQQIRRGRGVVFLGLR
ncbi:MAG: right-handed parallel beta-helix repeat-containing protein [Phycisphaerales bacterium]|nr:MAG: right-handed parallel beta-helix repeat-containing protein [Phycisphaerales bacterium]